MRACGVRAGRVNGKLRIQSHDADTWRFPALRGRLRVAGAGFHFFDAPDDFTDTRLDLLFEGDRLYLHGAQGLYGAVPVTVNGARPSLSLFLCRVQGSATGCFADGNCRYLHGAHGLYGAVPVTINGARLLCPLGGTRVL